MFALISGLFLLFVAMVASFRFEKKKGNLELAVTIIASIEGIGFILLSYLQKDPWYDYLISVTGGGFIGIILYQLVKDFYKDIKEAIKITTKIKYRGCPLLKNEKAENKK